MIRSPGGELHNTNVNRIFTDFADLASRRPRAMAVAATLVAILGLVGYSALHLSSVPNAVQDTADATGPLPINPRPPSVLRPGNGDRRPIDCDAITPAREPEPEANARREAALASMLDAIAAELANSAAVRDRALGLYIQLSNGGGKVHAQFAQQNPQCDQDPSCGAREDAAVAQARAPTLDALATLATASNDADAYGLAFLACPARDDARLSGACAQISARQWARIEPQNALPWLFVAGEAAHAAQAPLVADALYQASQATRSDSHWSVFAKVLDAAALQGQGVDVRNDVAMAALGMALATRFAQMQPVLAYCTADAVADPNRHQTCDALAHLLTERSDTAVSLLVGTRMAERLGWSRARVAQLEELRDAYLQIGSDRYGPDPASCTALEQRRAWIARTLSHGEIAAAQGAIADSGQTAAQWASRRRAAVRQQPSAVAAHAAGAATAPP